MSTRLGACRSAATRKPDEPGLHEQAAQGEIEWHDLWAYYAGRRTQDRIASYENDHANMLDNPDYRFLVERPLAEFEPGKPYGHRTRQWQAGELEVDFRRGDKDATIAGLEAKHYVVTVAFDHDFDVGDETPGERFEFRRDFWFASDLPYSRLQTQHLEQHLFLDASNERLKAAAGRLNDAVLGRLEPQMRKAGMLVKTRIERDEETIVTEIHNLRRAPALDTQPVADTPLLRSWDQYMALLEPLFGQRHISTNPPPGGESSLTLPAGQASGKAGFQVGEAGDLALALTFESASGDNGYLFLVRPYHGRPATGSYDVVGKRDEDALEQLSTEELEAHAENFQVVGLIKGEDRLTAIVGETADGQVQITASDEEHLAGRMDLEVEALAAYANGKSVTLPDERRIRGGAGFPAYATGDRHQQATQQRALTQPGVQRLMRVCHGMRAFSRIDPGRRCHEPGRL
ncbi:MAG: hypothetical protein U5L11_06790 [Arhodomonas sp.]|nr:hypothetical protein [Arhodomonas sp.]